MIAGIGVDIIEIERVSQALARTPRFGEHIFTEAEAAYCGSRARPAQSFALCFAAKEAVIKALGISEGHLNCQDTELLHDEHGVPSIKLHGKTAQLAAERHISKWHISCSHDDTQAIVFVVAEGL